MFRTFTNFTKLFKKNNNKTTITQIGVKDEGEAVEAGTGENPRKYHGKHKDFIKSSMLKLIEFMDGLREHDVEKDIIHESVTAKIHAVFYEWCLLMGIPNNEELFWKAFTHIVRIEMNGKNYLGYQKGSLVLL